MESKGLGLMVTLQLYKQNLDSFLDRNSSEQPTSFPGSFIQGKKDPGSGWSRASQKVGGDKKTAGGRGKQVPILAFLRSLWKGKICLKM